MQVDLSTTNLLLGIMATVSVLQGLVLIGMAVMGYRMYQQAMAMISDVERRHIAPLAATVNEVVKDVKEVTARVNHETERLDHAIRDTIDRVDETAGHVKTRVRDKAGRAIHAVIAVRNTIERILTNNHRHQPPAEAAGTA
jgi:hypothetical protein